MSDRIWKRIESARRRWDVLRHPFYRRWSAGDLTTQELARYAGQYRHAVNAIATLSAAAAEAAPERPELRQHAIEEQAHLGLWDGFVEASGGTSGAAPTTETEQCVRAWTADGDLLSTLVRLYAIESGQPEISRIKRAGLTDRYGFSDGPATAYFRLHESRDLEHAAEARELVAGLADPQDADRLVGAAESAFRANWRLLDGV